MEVLIVTSLMTLVAGAIVAVLTGGFKIWKRVADYGTHEQAALIAFEGLRRDLRNHRQFALVPFEGDYEEFGFAVVSQEAHDSEMPQEIGRLGYFLDERRHLLCRSFIPYRAMRRARPRDQCDAVLHGVQRVRFDYFGSRSETAPPGWSQRLETKASPMAVKASLTLQEGKEPPSSHSCVVYLPTTIGAKKQPDGKS